jgi:opacity protein-like surface antigen
MNKLLICVAAAAGLAAGSASAADMPVKAPPIAPVYTWSWTGFYIGGHAGYGWKENDFAEVISVVPPVTLGGISSKGSVYGFQAGYNWQYGWWVGGLEIDLSSSSISGDSTPVTRTFGGGVSITDIESDDVRYLGSVRARLGFALFQGCCWNALIYGTGGLAWERVRRIDSTLLIVPGTTQAAVSTTPRDHFGYVVGVGGELQLGNSNWIARVEYLHYDFDQVEQTTTVTTFPATPGGTFADTPGKQTIDVVRFALSYKFGP